MANTHDLKKIVEPHVREELEKRFKRKFLKEDAPLPLITGGSHEFDAVSIDREVVIEIKTTETRDNGKVGIGSVKSIFYDLYLLRLVNAKNKILILTDKRFHDFFLKKAEGKITEDITIEYMELPADIKKKVNQIHKDCRSEIKKQ